jgi:D-aminopeptidase
MKKKLRKRKFTSIDIEGISGNVRPEQVLLGGKDYVWTKSAIYAVKMLLRFEFQPA